MAKKVYGNMGKILHVDLTRHTYKVEDATKYYKDWLGGRALSNYLLFKNVDVAKVDPLSPDNVMVISTGALSGTVFPSSGRTQAVFISPFNTSGWGASNCGGHFGPALKYSGYDALILKGKSPKPVYLYIENDKIEFVSAKGLWGRGCIDTQAMLLNKHGVDAKLLCIGQAGENLIPFSNVRTELTNSMGRTGAGAVFGSKNLKAVVAMGTKPIRIYKPKEFFKLSKEVRDKVMDPHYGKIHSLTYKLLAAYGVPGVTNLIASTGMTPIRNWQRCGIDPKFNELVTEWFDKWGQRREGCFTCPVHCHATYAVNDGKYPCRGGGPEYETTTAFGHKCDVTDARAVLKLNSMCNDYGLDTVSTGAMFSTLMDLRERGIIDKKWTDGVDLKFGNGDAMVELMPKLVFRKGCGKLLAKGAYHIAKDIGPEAVKSVYQVKGMCATGVEIRSTTGSALQFCVSPRGMHHLSGLPTAEWVNWPPVAIYTTGYKEAGDIRSYHPQAKAKLVRYYENLFFMSDSVGLCKFTYGHLGWWHDSAEAFKYMLSSIRKGIYYATGIKYTQKELFHIYEKAYQIERATIALRGIRRKDDMPPYKARTETCPGEHPFGPKPLPPIDMVKFNKMLDAYYKERGWDRKTGIPKPKHLESLGLKEVADKLRKDLGV